MSYVGPRRLFPRDGANAYDTHEFLKRQIGSPDRDTSASGSGTNVNQSLAPIGMGDNFTYAPNPPQSQGQGSTSANPSPTGLGSTGITGFADTILYFDSIYANTNSMTNLGQLIWNIGPINSGSDITNCVEIKIEPFWFPNSYLNNGGNGVAPPYTPSQPSPAQFYFRRVFMLIQGLPSRQSAQASEGKKYHFEFYVADVNGYASLLVPLNDTYYFQSIVQSITQMQAQFLLPPYFTPIPLYDDVITVTIQIPNNGQNFTFQTQGGVPLTIFGPIATVYNPPVAVYITGANSPWADVNALLNNPLGTFVTQTTSFITAELSLINTTTDSIFSTVTATMLIPQNRIAFSMRFTSVVGQPTNYLYPCHI